MRVEGRRLNPAVLFSHNCGSKVYYLSTLCLGCRLMVRFSKHISAQNVLTVSLHYPASLSLQFLVVTHTAGEELVSDGHELLSFLPLSPQAELSVV